MMRRLSCIFFVSMFCNWTHAQDLKDNFYVKILSEELQRNIKRLKLPELEKPFFIAYNLRNNASYSLWAARGLITSTANVPVKSSSVSVKLRVGNYHRNFDYLLYDGYFVNLPDEADVDEYKRLLWLETDRAYKSNAQQYSSYMAALKRLTVDEEELALDDMAKINPVVFDYGAVAQLHIDENKWENLLKELSALFKKDPSITDSYCTLHINSYDDYLVTSEGTIVRKPNSNISFIAFGSTSGDEDENANSAAYSITVKDINDLPSKDSLEKAVRQIIATIQQKKSAAPFDGSYMGPVLFSGNALNNIIYECFVNTLSTKRKSILGMDGVDVDYEEKLGQKLVSNNLSVMAVPKLKEFEGKKTTGAYPIDDEGVQPPDSLVLIKNGILKSLINGRTPTKKFPLSQGFAQSFMGRNFSAGVLKITSSKKAPSDSMIQKLRQLAKEEGLPFAYMVKDFSYGNSEMYKIDVATGETEMVNEFKITPLNVKSLRRFALASTEMRLSNAPEFSIIAPESIIVNEVEIEKKDNTTKPKPIIVSNPLVKDNGSNNGGYKTKAAK